MLPGRICLIFILFFSCITTAKSQFILPAEVEAELQDLLNSEPARMEARVNVLEDSLQVNLKTDAGYKLLYYKAYALINLSTAWEAYGLLKTALEDPAIENLPLSKGRLLNLLGKSQAMLENKEEAMKMYLQALDLFEQHAGDHELGMFYIDISEFYRRKMDDLESRKKYLEKTWQIIRANMFDYHLQARYYNRMADQVSTSSRDSVILYSNLAIKYAKLAGNLNIEGSSYNELGNVYELMKDPIAESYYKKAGALFIKTGNRLELAHSMLNYARFVHEQVPDWDRSLRMLDSVRMIMKEEKWYYQQQMLHSSYERYYRDEKNWDSAFFHHTEAMEWKGRDLIARLNASTNQIQIQYETEKERKKAEEEKREGLERLRQRNWLIGIAVMAVLFSLLAVWLVMRLRKGNKNLVRQAKEIEIMNSELSESLKQKDALFSEVHHRVKNNLMVISGLLELHADDTNDSEISANYRECMKRIRSMGLVHELIYRQHNIAEVNVGEYIKLLSREIMYTHPEQENIILGLECDDIQFSLDNAVPFGIIMNELFTNSLKHAKRPKEKLYIRIRIRKTEGAYELVFRDSGPGVHYDPAAKGHSIGMYLLNGMSRQLNGAMEQYNESGAVFMIRFKGRNK